MFSNYVSKNLSTFQERLPAVNTKEPLDVLNRLG